MLPREAVVPTSQEKTSQSWTAQRVLKYLNLVRLDLGFVFQASRAWFKRYNKDHAIPVLQVTFNRFFSRSGLFFTPFRLGFNLFRSIYIGLCTQKCVMGDHHRIAHLRNKLSSLLILQESMALQQSRVKELHFKKQLILHKIEKTKEEMATISSRLTQSNASWYRCAFWKLRLPTIKAELTKRATFIIDDCYWSTIAIISVTFPPLALIANVAGLGIDLFKEIVETRKQQNSLIKQIDVLSQHISEEVKVRALLINKRINRSVLEKQNTISHFRVAKSYRECLQKQFAINRSHHRYSVALCTIVFAAGIAALCGLPLIGWTIAAVAFIGYIGNKVVHERKVAKLNRETDKYEKAYRETRDYLDDKVTLANNIQTKTEAQVVESYRLQKRATHNLVDIIAGRTRKRLHRRSLSCDAMARKRVV